VSEARHPGRGSRLFRWLPVLLVLVLLGAAVAAWRLDLDLGPEPDPQREPAAVLPPVAGLQPVADPPVLAEPAPQDAPVARARLTRALDRLLKDPDLGKDVHALVAPLDGGAPVYQRGTGPATPASTLKLLTCAAALEDLGADHTFTTRVVRSGHTVTIVGGGDPLLARKPSDGWPDVADLRTLAADTARALSSVRRVRLAYDASLFPGNGVDPHWEADYVPDSTVSPIDALWVDEGRRPDSYFRVEDPARTAAEEFAALLRKRGVEVEGTVSQRRAASTATELASAESPPLSQIVEHTLMTSDNEAAEVLARHVGIAVRGDASFSASAGAVAQSLDGLGVTLGRSDMYDGSGLARDDDIDPRALLDVLRLAAERPELRSLLTGLPVAGYNGTLGGRFLDVPAGGVGQVRAKTGTLNGVSSLAGVATSRTGEQLVFVLMADKIDPLRVLYARATLDRLAATVAAAA
jgi:D-alanyl-D-alanine carboxypeptidase/D-alanyl-D-alanine-endopeptidase (penicillin-binding protein 4)